LMPHPERAISTLLGSNDGCHLLRSLLHSSSSDSHPAGADATAAAAGAGRLRSEP
jgi:hypothetical protein